MKEYNNFKTSFVLLICLQLFIGCTKGDDQGTNVTQAETSCTIDENNLLVGETIIFLNTSSTGNLDVSYLWNFGDNTTSSEQNPSHIYSELGDFIVTLTSAVGNTEDTFSKELSIGLPNDIPERNTLLQTLAGLDQKIMVCAHRANYSGSPENSLKSIADAIDNNIGMVELDVRQTKDGELVLMHDETIDRTTNGSGLVSDFTLHELQQFNLFKANGVLTNEKIPTLKQVLGQARGKIYIDLDIDKKASFTKVFPLVNQYGMLKQVLFYSSEYNVISTMINFNNDNVLGMPIVRNQNDFNQYTNLNIDVIQFNVDDTSVLEQVNNNGWYFFRNAYVNTSLTPQADNFAQLNEVINLGGSIVQTDNVIDVKTQLQFLNLNY